MMSALLSKTETVQGNGSEWQPEVGFLDLRPTLPLTSIATLGRLPDMSVLQSPHLFNGNDRQRGVVVM